MYSTRLILVRKLVRLAYQFSNGNFFNGVLYPKNFIMVLCADIISTVMSRRLNQSALIVGYVVVLETMSKDLIIVSESLLALAVCCYRHLHQQ